MHLSCYNVRVDIKSQPLYIMPEEEKKEEGEATEEATEETA